MSISNLTSTVALVGLLGATSAFGQTVDVQQSWTSGSESKAMNAIADAYKARGGKWIDSPSADFDSALAAATSRIAGGEPPSAVLMAPNSAMRDLATTGQLRNLDDLATAGGWQKVMPPLIWEKLNVDGHLVALPLGVHGDNWIWYSKPLFAKLNIEEPKSLDEMFAAADKLKAAGYTAFAVGGEPWQELSILTGLIIAVGGPEYWNKLIVERDPEAMKSPLLVEIFDRFRKVSTYADAGSPGRSWNETANMVVADKAGMQIMGDWARGEFLAAGKVPDRDFGCFVMPGARAGYVMIVDIFAFPANTDEDRVKGQALLAETLMDPAVAAKVSSAKGSVPARMDVDTKMLDSCAIKGAKALAMPGAAVASAYDALPGDLSGQMTDLATQFWTDPTMTSQAGAENLGSLLQSQ